MDTALDTILPIAGLLTWLTILTAVFVAAHRQIHPYKVVGHSYDTGMTIISWRDEPDQTHWLTPAHLQQQIGVHR